MNIWCPYTDKELDLSLTTPEHIVPLSLGGVNAFTIPVDAKFNAVAGGKIDGVIANDFLTLIRRREFDARGHSNRSPEATVRKGQMGDSKRPVQVTFQGKDGTRVWDAMDRRYVQEEEMVGQTFSVQFSIKPLDRLRFLAKVALSAGYFIYGNKFRENVKHDELRKLMNAQPSTMKSTLKNSQLRAYYEFSAISEVDKRQVELDSFMFSAVNGSAVVACPGPENVGFSVGILGKWVGTLNVPANTTNFPLYEDHDLGHVVLLAEGNARRIAYRKFAREVHESMQAAGMLSGDDSPTDKEATDVRSNKESS